MNKVFSAELFKLKHSKILWLIGFTAVFIPLIYTFSELMYNNQPNWGIWVSKNLTLFVTFACPIFSLLVGYIVAREYQDKTIDNLFAYPYSRLRFLVGKTTVSILIIIVTCLLAFGLVILAGVLVGVSELTTDTFLSYLYAYLVTAGIYVALTPLWIFASILGKSYIPAILIGVAILSTPGPIGGSDAYKSVVQFILGFAGIGESVNIWPWISLFGLFFIFFWFLACIFYTKSDVRGGA